MDNIRVAVCLARSGAKMMCSREVFSLHHVEWTEWECSSHETHFLRLCSTARFFFLLVLPCGGKKTTKQKTIENQLSATHISCKSRGHWICISDSFNWLITIHANTEFCFAILIRPKRNSLPKAP